MSTDVSLDIIIPGQEGPVTTNGSSEIGLPSSSSSPLLVSMDVIY